LREGYKLNPKIKKLFDRYKTYEGERGSPAQWAAAARQVYQPASGSSLLILGLTGIPASLAELKKARREAMLTAHPDKMGGSEETAKKINQAYEKLVNLIPNTVPVNSVEPAPMPSGLVQPPRCVDDVPSIIDHNHIGELKLDGERFVLYIGHDPYERREGNTFLSRHKSKVDGRFGDRTDNIPHITGPHYKNLHMTKLDGEIYHTDLATTGSIMRSDPSVAIQKQNDIGKATYFVFDIPFHNGKDLRQLPLNERRKILFGVLEEMNNPYIKPIEFRASGIEKYFQEVAGKGGEGIVIKDLRCGYGQGWAKMKKSSDVSCVVTGFRQEEHSISLAVSVFDDGKAVEVGFVPGFDDIDKYLGRVMDIFAFELTKNGKLRSPSFNRFRDDVNPEECTLEKLKGDMKKIKNNRRRT